MLREPACPDLQELTAHLFPALSSVVSHCLLVIGRGGSIYTVKWVNATNHVCFFPFGEPVVKHLPAHHLLYLSIFTILDIKTKKLLKYKNTLYTFH